MVPVLQVVLDFQVDQGCRLFLDFQGDRWVLMVRVGQVGMDCTVECPTPRRRSVAGQELLVVLVLREYRAFHFCRADQDVRDVRACSTL